MEDSLSKNYEFNNAKYTHTFLIVRYFVNEFFLIIINFFYKLIHTKLTTISATLSRSKEVLR